MPRSKPKEEEEEEEVRARSCSSSSASSSMSRLSTRAIVIVSAMSCSLISCEAKKISLRLKKGIQLIEKIPQENILGAIAECLEEDERGACEEYGKESEYGQMKDWDVSEVVDLDYAFFKKDSFDGDLSKWDVSQVTSMREMFSGARDFSGKNGLGMWDTGNVVDMGSMFAEASNFKGAGLKKWDVRKVTDMSFMLKDAVDFKEDLSLWRPVSCTTTYGMFQNAVEFESDVKEWGMKKKADTKDMFLGAANFLGRFQCNHPLNGPPSTCEDSLGGKSSSSTTSTTSSSSSSSSSKKGKPVAMKYVAAMGTTDNDFTEDEVHHAATTDSTQTSSASFDNQLEVNAQAAADLVEAEDDEPVSSVPMNVAYPHQAAEETPSSSSSSSSPYSSSSSSYVTTTTTTTSYSSSSSPPSSTYVSLPEEEATIIDCDDGECPEGTAESIKDLPPDERKEVRDALNLNPLNITGDDVDESRTVTSTISKDEFLEGENDDDNEDGETVEVSKDQIEDLVEDKEAFDAEFAKFMEASKEEKEAEAEAEASKAAKIGEDEEQEREEMEAIAENMVYVESASMTNPLKVRADGTKSKTHMAVPQVIPVTTEQSSSKKQKGHHNHVMDQIDDEDVDEELERLKKKLNRLQSETPEEIEAEKSGVNRHKQLDDKSFYRAVSKCLLESSAGLCVEYGAVTRFGMMPDWDVSEVTTMTHAFQNQEEFNADLSQWNTKSVTDMSYMFYDCEQFNSDISNWNVAQVTSMKQMFRGAKALNQDVFGWFANRSPKEIKQLTIDGIFDGAQKLENAYECGLSKFIDNAMDMCRFSNTASKGAKATAKSSAKSSAKMSSRASAKISAKDASSLGNSLESEKDLPSLGWNVPTRNEDAHSSIAGAGFATMYILCFMAFTAIAIRTKRESIINALEAHFYSNHEEVPRATEPASRAKKKNNSRSRASETRALYGASHSSPDNESLLL